MYLKYITKQLPLNGYQKQNKIKLRYNDLKYNETQKLLGWFILA